MSDTDVVRVDRNLLIIGDKQYVMTRRTHAEESAAAIRRAIAEAHRQAFVDDVAPHIKERVRRAAIDECINEACTECTEVLLRMRDDAQLEKER